MTSNPHYIAYLRVLRQQLRYSQPARTTSFPQPYRSTRAFSISPSLPSSQQAAAKPPSPSPPKPASPSEGKSNPNTVPSVSFARQTALKIADKVRQKAPLTTETYIAYGACENLMKECARQADYTIPQAKQDDRSEIPKSKNGEDLGVGTGWWYEVLGLTPTFNTWTQVTFLHMYFLTVRIRALPPTHAPTWHQHLLDHFFYMAEDRMVRLHALHARSVRNKYLKDLFVQWRGLLAGYDEGVAKGEDAVLATALWRNLFGADEDVDLTHLAAVVSYTRGVLVGLDQMDQDVLVAGEVAFSDPASQLEEILVRIKSQVKMKPFEEGIQPGGEQSKAGHVKEAS